METPRYTAWTADVRIPGLGPASTTFNWTDAALIGLIGEDEPLADFFAWRLH